MVASFTIISLLPASSAFTATRSACMSPGRSVALHFLFSEQGKKFTALNLSTEDHSDKHDEQQHILPSCSHHLSRRHVLQAAGVSSLSMWQIAIKQARAADGYNLSLNVDDEEDDGIIDSNRRSNDGRVVLRTSTSNVPIKYETKPVQKVPQEEYSSAISEVGTANSSGLCRCESTEERRIRVFERAAPSTVYIDTYAVQRDAFTPNMQVLQRVMIV